MIEEMDVEGLDEIDVDIGQYAEANAPQRIGTVGLGPCIGIVILDDANARAWVFHSPNFLHAEDLMSEVIVDIAGQHPLGHGLRVFLVGGDDRDFTTRTSVQADRHCVEGVIARTLPAAALVVQWSELPYFMLEHDGVIWREIDGLDVFTTP